MNADEYQYRALQACWITDDKNDRLTHGVLGLASEAGEVAGIFQKQYQGHEPTEDHVVKECGDCLWMIAEILDSIGITLSECMERNLLKLKNRYPNGFEPEKSLHRKPGDV